MIGQPDTEALLDQFRTSFRTAREATLREALRTRDQLVRAHDDQLQANDRYRQRLEQILTASRFYFGFGEHGDAQQPHLLVIDQLATTATEARRWGVRIFHVSAGSDYEVYPGELGLLASEEMGEEIISVRERHNELVALYNQVPVIDDLARLEGRDGIRWREFPVRFQLDNGQRFFLQEPSRGSGIFAAHREDSRLSQLMVRGGPQSRQEMLESLIAQVESEIDSSRARLDRLSATIDTLEARIRERLGTILELIDDDVNLTGILEPAARRDGQRDTPRRLRAEIVRVQEQFPERLLVEVLLQDQEEPTWTRMTTGEVRLGTGLGDTLQEFSARRDERREEQAALALREERLVFFQSLREESDEEPQPVRRDLGLPDLDDYPEWTPPADPLMTLEDQRREPIEQRVPPYAGLETFIAFMLEEAPEPTLVGDSRTAAYTLRALGPEQEEALARTEAAMRDELAEGSIWRVGQNTGLRLEILSRREDTGGDVWSGVIFSTDVLSGELGDVRGRAMVVLDGNDVPRVVVDVSLSSNIPASIAREVGLTAGETYRFNLDQDVLTLQEPAQRWVRVVGLPQADASGIFRWVSGRAEPVPVAAIDGSTSIGDIVTTTLVAAGAVAAAAGEEGAGAAAAGGGLLLGSMLERERQERIENARTRGERINAEHGPARVTDDVQPTVVPTNQPEFLVTGRNADPQLYPAKDRRWGRDEEIDFDARIPLEVERLSLDTFRLRPASPLEPGNYIFSYGYPYVEQPDPAFFFTVEEQD